jgi:hypothetical protein
VGGFVQLPAFDGSRWLSVHQSNCSERQGCVSSILKVSTYYHPIRELLIACMMLLSWTVWMCAQIDEGEIDIPGA